MKFLPSAAARVARVEKVGPRWTVESVGGVGVAWSGGAAVDGKPWPLANDATVWLPAGGHTLEAGTAAGWRVLDFNGEVRSAETLPGGEVRIAYSSSSRAIAILEKRPGGVELDRVEIAPEVMASGANWALLLPRGEHRVRIW